MKSPLAHRLVADRSRLVELARRIVRTRDDAEDVVHDVLLRIGDVRHADAPDAWLATAVRNAAIDRTRRAARERRLAPWAAGTDAARDAPDALVVAADEVAAALRTLLARAGAHAAALWLLREAFGVDYEVLARALGVGEAGARQAVHRATVRIERGRDVPGARSDEEDFLAVCRHAFASGDTGGLLALVQRAPVSATAISSAGTGTAMRAKREDGALTQRLVQHEGRYALALECGGMLICALPLGPLETELER